MPNAGAKFSSEYLPKERMHAVLLALPGVLQRLLGEHDLVGMYGCGARIHAALMWQRMGVSTYSVQYLIEDSIEQRIVIPGESDFHFEVPENRLEVLLCHEC